MRGQQWAEEMHDRTLTYPLRFDTLTASQEGEGFIAAAGWGSVAS
jgi:hypothetical protein